MSNISTKDLRAIRQLLVEEVNLVAQWARMPLEQEIPGSHNYNKLLHSRELLKRWEERLAWIDEEIQKLLDKPKREERRNSRKLFYILLKRKINLAKAKPESIIHEGTAIEDFLGFVFGLDKLLRERSRL